MDKQPQQQPLVTQYLHSVVIHYGGVFMLGVVYMGSSPRAIFIYASTAKPCYVAK